MTSDADQDNSAGRRVDREEANVAIVYAYLVKAYDDLLTQRDRVAERANKLVLVTTLVFAALSYGGGYLLVIAKNPSRHDGCFWASVVVGLTAGAALIVSFLVALSRSRIKVVNIPGTVGLGRRVSDAGFRKANHASIVAALSANVAGAFDANLKRQDESARWVGLLDWAPRVGFICTAIFVAANFAQVMALPSSAKDLPSHRAMWTVPRQEEKTMSQAGSDKEKDKDNNGKNDQDPTANVVKDIIQPPHEVKGDDHSKTKIRADRSKGG